MLVLGEVLLAMEDERRKEKDSTHMAPSEGQGDGDFCILIGKGKVEED